MELSESSITDRTREAVVFHHSSDVQGLDHDG
jgi:hypothetical protein